MTQTLAALPGPMPGALTVPASPLALTQRVKAAIVVRFLINEGIEIALEDLPDDLQAILTHQMANLRLVDRETVEQVLEEFSSRLDAVGLSFPGNMVGALEALDGKISAHTAARLRKEAGVRHSGDPWKRIETQDPETLQPVFESESPEICAVILSKLPVSTAAQVLALLPGPTARAITYAVSQTSGIGPDAVERIGISLAAQLDSEPVVAFDEGPVERVGAILNSSTAATREDVLNGLDETDTSFANEVRKAIFTFANIPERVASRDMPAVLRATDQEEVITALAAANQTGLEAVTEFILANISARMADQFREEIEERGDVKTTDGENAMSSVVAAIRQLETAGTLILLQPSEDDE